MISQNLHPALAAALAARGYAALTPVQEAVVQAEAAGRDLLVSAKTGSGKTVAYGLALAEELINPDSSLPEPAEPRALVIAPTRELAIQVQRELSWLYAGARVASCVGGMDPRAERRALERGAQIVVGTPGRLRDHLERGALVLSKLNAVVLDEADEMLDLGFREELEAILDAAPKSRRTLLFSATMPKTVAALASEYQRDALRLEIGGRETQHADIDYRAIRVAPHETELAVVNVLRFFDPKASIIFCSTREGVRKLHANLVERGFNVVALSGELSQNERSRALQALRDGRSQICVATDVAARGIDIPDLDLVIQADLPLSRETLQHRSGRTGRAGKKGVCVVLVTPARRRKLDMMLKGARIEATWQAAPSAEEIRAKDQARLIAEVGSADDASEEDLGLARQLLAERSAEAVALAYLRIARAAQPAAEELAELAPEPEPRAPRSRDRDNGDRGQNDGGYPPREEAPRPGFEDAVWFAIALGANRNAEARWLLPLICRRGHVTRGDIGAIRVFAKESRFQIVAAAVERFEQAMVKGDGDGGRIWRVEDHAPPPARDRRFSSKRHRDSAEDAEPREYTPRPPREDRAPREDRPYRERPERPERREGEARPAYKERPPREERPPRDERPARSDRPAKPFAKPYAKPQAKPKRGEGEGKPWTPVLHDGPGEARPKKKPKPKR
jgi:ATP-dependent RNA helicase DeaD